jgi:hypothetical protein
MRRLPNTAKKQKREKRRHRGAKQERRKDEKLTSSHTSTTPLMISFPLRAHYLHAQHLSRKTQKPPKSLATRTNPTKKKIKILNSVALALTLNPSAVLAKKFSGQS